MSTLHLVLISLLLLLPPTQQTEPCPTPIPNATTEANPETTLQTEPCAATPTPQGSTINMPFVGTGNGRLQTGDNNTPANDRSRFILTGGLGMILIGLVGLILVVLNQRKKARPQ